MLGFATQIAKEAGLLLKQMLEKAEIIATKQNMNDLVTSADRACEELLVQKINQVFPDHQILGEEGTGSKELLEQDGYVWVIDPLDGTVNYSQQLPIFCVSIGLMKDQQPHLGVIYLPMLNELFYAEKGKGAFLNGTKLAVSSQENLYHSVLASGFPYDKDVSEQNNLMNFDHIVPKIRGIRRMGAAAVDLAYVAAGRLDGYWEEKINPWDVLAGLVLIEEAGGKVTNYAGEKITFHENHYVATNGHLHQPLLDCLVPYREKYFKK